MKKWYLFFVLLVSAGRILANSILIPMDDKQSNHLKAYGVAFWELNTNT